MIISKTHAAKLNTTCLQLCCIYAVYMALIKSFPGMVLSFGVLMPAYFTAALLHKAGQKALPKRPLQWMGAGAGLIYTIVLFSLITHTLPWEWISLQTQINFDAPLKIISHHFNLITICAIGPLLWYMGWRQAGINIDFAVMFLEFQVGFGILFLVLITTHGLNIEVATLPLIVGLFFALGLVGLVLCRKNHISPNNERLSQMLAMSSVMGIILIFILAGLFMLLASPETIDTLLYIGRFIRTWIWNLILGLMDFFLNLFPPKDVETSLGDYDSITKLAIDSAIKQAKSPSKTLREILHIVYALFWAGVVIASLWRMSVSFLEFLKKWKTAPHNVTYETMPGAFRADLFQWLMRLRQGIKKTIRQIMMVLGRILPLDIFLPGAFPKTPRVKKIYTDMLKWSSKKGARRNPHQTPAEHGRHIFDHAPGAMDEIRIITGLYEKYRYGDIAPSPEEELKLIQAWRTLKKAKFTPENRRNSP